MVGCLGSTYVSWSAAKPDRAPITIETNGLANEGETRFAMGRRPARRMWCSEYATSAARR